MTEEICENCKYWCRNKSTPRPTTEIDIGRWNGSLETDRAFSPCLLIVTYDTINKQVKKEGIDALVKRRAPMICLGPVSDILPENANFDNYFYVDTPGDFGCNKWEENND